MYEKYFNEVLDHLRGAEHNNPGGWVAGMTLREWLNEERNWLTRWSGPRFYQLMANMEDAKLVESTWLERVHEGDYPRQRAYRLPTGVLL